MPVFIAILFLAVLAVCLIKLATKAIKKEREQETSQQDKDALTKIEQAEDLGTIATILAENDAISVPKDNRHNSFGDDLSHLDKDGELPFGWVHHYSQFVEQQEKKIDKKWEAVYSATSTQAKLNAFKNYFCTVTKVGEVCKDAGECHYKWFCENIIGSVWYNSHLKEYEQLKIDAPEFIKREKLLANLESAVMAKLQENNGILQSDFIKLFDPAIKSEVSSFLCNANKAGKVKRTKSGRSYILEVK